jgi:hypothetical protein
MSLAKILFTRTYAPLMLRDVVMPSAFAPNICRFSFIFCIWALLIRITASGSSREEIDLAIEGDDGHLNLPTGARAASPACERDLCRTSVTFGGAQELPFIYPDAAVARSGHARTKRSEPSREQFLLFPGEINGFSPWKNARKTPRGPECSGVAVLTAAMLIAVTEMTNMRSLHVNYSAWRMQLWTNGIASTPSLDHPEPI